jgi:hypothetical protein
MHPVIEPVPPATLLARLVDPASAEEAAAELAAIPLWLTGTPPPEVVTALGDPRNPHDGAIVDLARQWRPAALIPALVSALDDETAADRRRRLAWTLKQIADTDAVPALLPGAISPDEDRVVRRYLIEGISRAASSTVDLWPQLEPVIRTLATDADHTIREAAAALTASGEDHDTERRRILLAFLTDPDPTVIAVTAAALRRYAPLSTSDVPQPLADRLLHHPDPRVHRTVRDILINHS